MYVVHIYAEADSAAPKESERMTGYVLECEGKQRTVEDFNLRTATYHAAILSTLCTALSRINQSCEVHIHTQNTYILNMIENNLPAWAGNGFCKKTGDPIRNDGLWKRFWGFYQKHLIVVEPGIHPYLNWMQDEMMKRKIAIATSNH